MIRTTDKWIDEYVKKDALWIHDGNPKRPHAFLPSGKHSNGFFNSRIVIPDEGLMRDAAHDLLELLALNTAFPSVQGVVGPQTGATKLAELLSDEMVPAWKHSCFFASPAKTEKDGGKSMTFNQEELGLLSGQRVLLCEDVLTTGGSVDLTATAVIAAGGIILPFVLVLVNRSGLAEVNGKKIVALIDRSMPMWTSEECPLCKQGSAAVRPKENWAALNAAY